MPGDKKEQPSELADQQVLSRRQFDRQSAHYGRTHILADISDVAAGLAHVPASNTATRRALDVATGGGHCALYLAKHGYNTTVCDLAPGMLKVTSEAARERGLSLAGANLHAAEALPYPDDSFELLTCRVAAHHFASVADFVREAARVLVPSGSLLIIDGSVSDNQPVAAAWQHQVEKLRDPSHGRFLTPSAWQSLCEAAGLNVGFSELSPFKQPDLTWYFDTAATSAENRAAVLRLVAEAPEAARSLFNLADEEGKIVWYWQRLTLVATKV